MFQIGSGGHTGIMTGCQKGRNFLNSVGYQSSSIYLALPDILRVSFRSNGQIVNVKQAPAAEFHQFISRLVEEFEDVDTQVWTTHLRWRVINACLADGELRLAEVPEGYLLEVVELPEDASEAQPEEVDGAALQAS